MTIFDEGERAELKAALDTLDAIAYRDHVAASPREHVLLVVAAAELRKVLDGEGASNAKAQSD